MEFCKYARRQIRSMNLGESLKKVFQTGASFGTLLDVQVDILSYVGAVSALAAQIRLHLFQIPQEQIAPKNV